METLKYVVVVVVVIVCALTQQTLSRPQSSAETCSAAADIVFILDSSVSIWIKHFKNQTAFVSEVINNFDIGPNENQTRVGVLTFGHAVWKKFDLNTIFDKKTMLQTVKNIQHGEGWRTNTGDAIKYAVTNMFTAAAGNRPGVPRIAIVITDGRSQNTFVTRIAAQKAHDSGITVFAIGVGSNLDFEELKEIASEPNSEHVFLVDDFTALSGITDKLTKRTCDVTETPFPSTTPLPTTTTTTATTQSTITTTLPPTTSLPTTSSESKPADQSHQDCDGKPAEVFFVVDASSSITRKDFNTEINFVKNIIKIFDIGQNKTRVGLIRFSHNAEMVLNLDNALNKDDLIESLVSIKHVGGGTNTAEALKLLRNNGFDKHSVRRNVPKIAIFLTDGLSADEYRTAKEARLTHDANIKVFSIGVGDGVDLVELKHVATTPYDEFVFQVNDFNSLDSIKDRLAIRTCGVKPDHFKDAPHFEPACTLTENTDLMFIYDITALGEEKSQAISAFLSNIVLRFDLASEYLHVGRITDNCPTGGNFQLTSKITSADFSDIRLSTFSHLIEKVDRSGFTSEYGGRDNSNNVGIIFIDAEMDSLDDKALRAVNNLSKKAEVFVVAMGHNHVIHQITKSFNTKNIIHLDTYLDLDGATVTLLEKLCNLIQPQAYEYDIAPIVPV